MRGHRLYRNLAEASLGNARRLQLDANVLKRRGSRGHACSLSILAIEESAKAIIYKQAADGVIRFVKKRANGVSTYSEQDLKDHKYKHGAIARLIGEAISFAPFYLTLAETRKRTFSRKEVERLLRKAHVKSKLLTSELQGEGRASQELKRVFEVLSRLDSLKNAGLYVGQEQGRLQVPDEAVAGDLANVIDLAELSYGAAAAHLQTTVTRRDAAEQREHARELLSQARRLRGSSG